MDTSIMYTVKLTFNYDWPLFRQTPGFSGIWGDYKFVIDNSLKECDFWIVYSDYLLQEECVKCNPENVIFIPAESYATSPKFSQEFLDQFGAIVTVQRQLHHRNIIYSHNANPWFVGKSYDELTAMSGPPEKDKLLSVVSSNKAFTEGHRKRLEFVEGLKDHFGDEIDVYGRGIRDFEDKWDVLGRYRYSLALENDFVEDWVTEKLFDCYYAFTFPIYYGCPNLEKYMPSDSFVRIDINHLDQSINVISQLLKDDVYNEKYSALIAARKHALNQENLFPFLVRILNEFDPTLAKEDFKLQLNKKLIPEEGRFMTIKRYLKNLVTRND